MAPPGRRVVLGAVAPLPAVPVLSTVQVRRPPHRPDPVRSCSGQQYQPGSTVAITAALPAPCTSGDTLIAIVSVAEQASVAGQVSAAPTLYGHAPSDQARRLPDRPWTWRNRSSS
jgi:hypothetical protein